MSFRTCLLGDSFGSWTVINPGVVHQRPNGSRCRMVECRCSCGQESWVQSGALRSGLSLQCRSCSSRKDISGQRFGSLVAIKSVAKYKRTYRWLCQCDCGETTKVLLGHLTSGHTSTCGDRTAHWSGSNNPNWGGYEQLNGTKWNSIVQGAKSRGIEFEITIKEAWDLFERQDHRCTLSGLLINLSERSSDSTDASLDRIDSSKGYILNNIQWVHKYINRMKGNLDEELFTDLCVLVAKRVVPSL